RARGFRSALSVRCRCGGSSRARPGSASLAATAPEPAFAPLRRLRQQLATLLERHGFRLPILWDLRVLLAVGDVGAVAAIQHLDVVYIEVGDDAVGIGFLLQPYDFERPLQRNRVWVVVLQRYILAAVLDVGAEAADVGDDRLSVGGRAERARQLEELHRITERDRVHLLPGPQAGETRLLDIVLGADLHERTVASHSHRDRLPGRRILAELTRLRDLLARDVLLDPLHLADEGLPELVERLCPVLLAA